MTDAFPRVTIPRDMLEDAKPSMVDQLVAAHRAAADRWFSMTPAERAEALDREEAARDARGNEWLRECIALEREAGLEYVTHLLDNMATAVGLDPWEAWRLPRHEERAKKLADMTATIRRDLAAAGHRPVTSALETTPR